MCHSQGKVYVYMREGDDEHVWAEWPDGTMDCRHRESGVIMRTRPDGEVVQVDPDNRALDAPPLPRPPSAAAPELSM